MKIFKNANVYVEGEGLRQCSVFFGERIEKIDGSLDNKAEIIELPENAVVLPGFIDQHIHGAGGCDSMDGTIEALETISKTLVKEGTTSFLVTTMTQSKENILQAMRNVKKYRERKAEKGARVLGIHLEGPFLSEIYKGAQSSKYLKEPDIVTFDEYNIASGNAIKIVTLAPEISGGETLIRYLHKKNILPSIGHSAAKVIDVKKAIEAGARNVTHTYNAQSSFHHREIGVAGSALLFDELSCELIADTIHVSIPAMKLLVKSKPADKLILITDSMRAKGIPDGISELGGQTVYVQNEEARLADGTLAGSVLRMNKAIKNMVEKVGVDFLRAVDFATINPAKALGMEKEIGSIKVGKRADFTVLDENYDVRMTVCGGEIVYKA